MTATEHISEKWPVANQEWKEFEEEKSRYLSTRDNRVITSKEVEARTQLNDVKIKPKLTLLCFEMSPLAHILNASAPAQGKSRMENWSLAAWGSLGMTDFWISPGSASWFTVLGGDCFLCQGRGYPVLPSPLLCGWNLWTPWTAMNFSIKLCLWGIWAPAT